MAKAKKSDWIVRDHAGIDTTAGFISYGNTVSLSDSEAAEILNVIPHSLEKKEEAS